MKWHPEDFSNDVAKSPADVDGGKKKKQKPGIQFIGECEGKLSETIISLGSVRARQFIRR
jgi:hypothetical protein